MMRSYPLLAASLIVGSTVAAVKTIQPQSRYLKEILMGRCYERPPTGTGASPDSCPSLVPALIGILQSHLDEDITPQSFENYISQADFSSPEDGAYFYLGSIGRALGATVPVPPGLVRPEDTLGGALLSSVSFCGTDARDDCPFGSWSDHGAGWKMNARASLYWGQNGLHADAGVDKEGIGGWTGAQASFWAGAYGAFAAEVSGRVTVAIPSDVVVSLAEDDDVTIFGTAAVPNLDPSKVTGLDLHVVSPEAKGKNQADDVSCSAEGIYKLKEAIKAIGISDFSCTEDPYLTHLYYCAGALGGVGGCSFLEDLEKNQCEDTPGTDSSSPQTADSGDQQEKKSHPGLAIVPLIIFVAIIGGALCFLVKSVGWIHGGSYNPIPDDNENPEHTTLPKQ